MCAIFYPDGFKREFLAVDRVQWYGKTIAMAQQALAWRKEYPKAQCITNFALSGEDEKLNDWRLLVGYKNGIQGVIACIDEMQNWFSSNQSKNFPPEMLEVITQNRKNRRVIMGTAQSFNRLAKPLREQATEVRKCYTFFGCKFRSVSTTCTEV